MMKENEATDFHTTQSITQNAEISIEPILARKGLRITETGSIGWRKDNFTHPRNWPAWRKTYSTLVIFFLEFFTTAISSAGPSAAEQARHELGLNRVVSLVVFTFTYQFGQAVGGVVIPPYSESFGRNRPYVYSCAAYSLFCLLIGLVPRTPMIAIGRFITGFGSAVPSVVIAGSVEDMFNSRSRVWMVLLWNWATTAGLVCGPVYGEYVRKNVGWRWIFYIAAIGTAANLLFIFGLSESRPGLLLERKVTRLRKTLNNPNLVAQNPDHTPNFWIFCQVALIRPVRLLFSEPLVAMISAMSAVSWGLIYFLTEALFVVYSAFGFDEAGSSLFFLALGLGIFLSFFPRLLTIRKLNRLQKKGLHPQPEDKIIGFHFATAALAIGLWEFAWTVPPRVTNAHWVISSIGLVLIGFAANEMAYTLSAYLSDAYTVYAASAFAALSFVRAIASGTLPLFAHGMYTNLGANIASSIIAALATVFCVSSWIFERYGRTLRQRSAFARYSLEVHRETMVDND